MHYAAWPNRHAILGALLAAHASRAHNHAFRANRPFASAALNPRLLFLMLMAEVQALFCSNRNRLLNRHKLGPTFGAKLGLLL
jgi:hypothetical protein